MGSHLTELPAAPGRVFAVLTDYERLPEWQGPLLACTVLERDERGRGRDVEYVVDARLRRVTYRLRHTYEEPYRIGSEYLGGDFDSLEGRWELTPRRDGGTGARLTMRIDPGLPLPARVIRKINERVLQRSVEDLAAALR
jgi:ribosome-associated toxin RatA of RatAB toxin-antitoxin module